MATPTGPQPDPVDGSAEGTPVTITPGVYVTEETLPPVPEGLNLVESAVSPDCESLANGPILVGEERECAITNLYEEEPPTTATLKVIKLVNCPSGPDCPESGDFQIEVTGNSPIPASFDGSPLGTDVDIGIGSYSVDETVPTLPPGLGTLTTTKSADCSGTISAGESKTCTITNTFTQSAT